MKKRIKQLSFNGGEAQLWKDADGGELSISIDHLGDGLVDSREVDKLIRFLSSCSEKMKKAGQ